MDPAGNPLQTATPHPSELFEMISSARHCTALTGAGISTLSGIPDFRGAGGLYSSGLPREFLDRYPSEVLALYLEGVNPFEKAFNIEEFEKDPSLFYTTAGPLVYTVHEKEPSIVHVVLAELENQGMLKSVITQNIDMLHQKAGSRRVIEIHGSPRTHYCLRCAGIRVGYEEAAACVRAGAMLRCPQCGAVLKPAITFYGEPLPLEARREAEEEAQSADLLLVLGTSLTVRPAADLPHTTLRRGGKLVIVNNTTTPLDGNAVLRFNDLREVFEGLRETVHLLSVHLLS
jgi:NAD-dependent deacetylase